MRFVAEKNVVEERDNITTMWTLLKPRVSGPNTGGNGLITVVCIWRRAMLRCGVLGNPRLLWRSLTAHCSGCDDVCSWHVSVKITRSGGSLLFHSLSFVLGFPIQNTKAPALLPCVGPPDTRRLFHNQPSCIGSPNAYAKRSADAR